MRAAARPEPRGGQTWPVRFLTRNLVRFYHEACQDTSAPNIFEALLRHLEIAPEVPAEELARVPASGPALVIANHPFGLLDGMVLAALLLRRRSDVKVMVNEVLAAGGPAANTFISVDVLSGRAGNNSRSLREAIEWLRSGGLLVVFPAGEVSSLRLDRWEVSDPAWNSSIARLARLTRATVVPAYFSGANSARFQMLGLIHPRLRTLRLPAEFFNKRGRRVALRVGRPVACERLEGLDDAQAIEYLRARTYLLGARAPAAPHPWTKAALPQLLRQFQQRQAVAPATPLEAVEREIAALPAPRTLLKAGEFTVLWTDASSPAILREIGRLRESTFRAAGEGTGKALDLDRFDTYYDQIVLWNHEKREIAGGYRIARSREVLAAYGSQGLYSSSLFDYAPGFFDRLGPAIELGRSFVHTPYQKQYAPLLLLWKGICEYLARHPGYTRLFGAVSISRDYLPASRHVLAGFLSKALAQPELAGHVSPRKRLTPGRLAGIDLNAAHRFARDLDDLSELISTMEPDGKGIPVLLRHYLKLGGRVLTFSVDEKFSGVLDALVLVDLAQADPRLLGRYTSKAKNISGQSCFH